MSVHRHRHHLPDHTTILYLAVVVIGMLAICLLAVNR